MRIYGPSGTSNSGPSSSARRTSSSSFSLPETAASSENKPAVAARSIGTIDALIALQSVEEPTERRKKAVKRGRTALDVLDDLKLQLLSGSMDSNVVQRLRSAASDLKMSSGDPGLDSVLSEIELRVEVELAKSSGG